MKAYQVTLVSVVVGSAVGAALAYARVGGKVELSAAAPLVTAEPSDQRLPVAKVEHPEHDFGVMQVGATRRHRFTVQNNGQATLTLQAGDTTCKCTSFTVSPGLVPPGGTAEAVVEWVAKAVPGNTFRQQATLQTSDPVRPTIPLTIFGEVINATGLEPDQFFFGEIAAGDQATASVVLSSTEEKDLQVEAIAPKSSEGEPWFESQVEPLNPADYPNPKVVAAFRVTLKPAAGLPIGRITEWVELKTNLPDLNKLEVPISGRVVGQITVHGSGWLEQSGVLRLGMVPRAEGITRRLLLSAKGKHAADTRYQVAEVDPPELQVQIGEPQKRREAVYHTPIEITVPAGTRPMVHLNNDQGEDGLVRLTTTHPESRELVLRVRFAVVD